MQANVMIKNDDIGFKWCRKMNYDYKSVSKKKDNTCYVFLMWSPVFQFEQF